MSQPALSVKPSKPVSTTSPAIASVSVLGVRFHCLTLEGLVTYVASLIQQRVPRQLCFSNAHTVSLVDDDPELAQALQNSHLVLADGMSVVWGARWVGIRLPERVAGPDAMNKICAQASRLGHRIYLLGSSVENLEALAAALRARWPGLQICGTHSPSMSDRFSDEENDGIIGKIREASPDILFVGMSCPKQEKWIAANLERCGVPVALGVGAAFDFLSGRIPRAPALLQKIGLEWAYRLYREPRRLWRRYLLGNALFLGRLVWQAARGSKPA